MIAATISNPYCASAEGHLHVHPPGARDEGQRQQEDREDGQDAQDVVGPVADDRLVRRLDRLDLLLVVLEHVPDPLRGVGDVVEVEVEVGGAVPADRPLEIAVHHALRAHDPPEVDDLRLGRRDVAHELARPALEELVLDVLELAPHLAKHREAGVDRLVDDPVKQVARPVGEELGPAVLVLGDAIEEAGELHEPFVGQRDDVVRADEEIQLDGLETPGRLVVAGEVENDEEVVVVDVHLGPLVARDEVLEGERVEVEVLGQPLPLGEPRALDVDPAQPVVLDGRDRRRCLSRRLGLDAGARGPGQPRADRPEPAAPHLARTRVSSASSLVAPGAPMRAPAQV